MRKVLLALLLVISLSCFSVELHTQEDYGTVSFYRLSPFDNINKSDNKILCPYTR